MIESLFQRNILEGNWVFKKICQASKFLLIRRGKKSVRSDFKRVSGLKNWFKIRFSVLRGSKEIF